MRVLFAGTPSIAVPSLEKLSRRHEVRAVLTNRDKPAGRGRKPEESAVKRCAAGLGLEVIEAGAMNAAVSEKVRGLDPELLVVVAFGKIFKKGFIDIFPRGGVNVHPSLLPKFRGTSPVSAAILAGEAETGVTIQRLALKFDSGDMLAQESIALNGEETSGSLTDRLALLGADLLCRVVDALEAGDAAATPQKEEDATYCRMLSKEDGEVDWTESAALIERKIRAYDPWPRASTTWLGRTLLLLKSKVYTGTLPPTEIDAANAPPGTVLACHPRHGLLVRTCDGILAVERLQLQFKKALDWRSFLNGHPDVIGSRFGG